MRQAISATVSRSWREIPHFTVTVEIDMQTCSEMIRELKGSDSALGYNDIVIKGCALALTRFPRLGAATVEDAAQSGIHIGFAVSLDNGLLVPVIRHCERLSPLEIAREAARLADRARSGRLSQAEMSGGGFTVSNLGMYGVDEFMALIMPGQTAVLAVGAVTERPVVRGGEIVIRPSMRVTLSSDHRSVDGAYAAAFLAELRRIMEQPLPMFL
jgi:pyruvate dehydrogenase E2 component (dihydrolipoamide acetyltransferase)